MTVQPHPTGGTAAAVNRTLTGSFTIQTRPDLDAEDEGFQITYVMTNNDTTNVTAQGGAALALVADSMGAQKVTIKDTDDQLFEWKLTTDSPKESGDIEVTLTADPTPVDRMYVTAISVDKAGYTVDNPSWTFDAEASGTGDDGPMATIMITPPDPDGDREMDTIMLKAVMGGTNIDRAEPLEIEVADIHTLPMADDITAKAYMDDDGDKGDDEAMSVMEGGDPVHVTVTVDRGEKGYPSGEGLEVTVSADANQALDYRVDPPEIDIASGTGEKSATFMLWALADDDIGMENLMLTLTAKGADSDDNGSGEVMSMFSIMIEDTTTPLVSAKDDAYDAIMMALGEDPLNPGDEVMIMNDDLFMYDDEMVSLSIGASVEGMGVSASASGEMVTLMAMEPGEAKVTVTATATPMADSLIVTQDRANVAQLTFPVMVELADLMITLSGARGHGHEHRRGHVGDGDGDGQSRGHRGHHGRADSDRRHGLARRLHGRADHDHGRRDDGHHHGDGGRRRHGGRHGDADPRGAGRGHEDQRPELLPLGCGGAGPADHRAAPAGVLPGHRRIPALPAAVAPGGGGGVRNAPLPPLPRSPGGEGVFLSRPGQSRSAGSPASDRANRDIDRRRAWRARGAQECRLT